MSYLRYLCVFAHSMPSTYCVVLCFSSSSVPYVASFSGLSIFDMFITTKPTITILGLIQLL